jgi:hypothetical protein
MPSANLHCPLLSPSPTNTNSIFTEDERNELLRLVLISKILHGKRERHEGFTTRDSGRTAVADAIVKLAIRLNLSAGYIFEFISTYADHRCDATKRKHMLIYLRRPRLFRCLAFTFSNHIYTHARIISATALNEDVRMVLGNAMKVF